jgi:hypothetical protein
MHRKASLAAGLFFAGTFVFSIPALPLYDAVLNDANYVVSGGGLDANVSLGAFLEILTIVCNVGTAIVLFPILRRQSESVALGYVAVRIFEGTMIAVGLMSLLSVVTLRDDLAGTAGTGSGSLVVAGHTLVALHDWTFLLGPAFCAGLGNGILLGYLMYTSGLVPRRMALLGLVGGPLALVTATAVLFGAWDQLSAISFLFTLPEIVWEASLTVYLLVKGFKPCPILADVGQAA